MNSNKHFSALAFSCTKDILMRHNLVFAHLSVQTSKFSVKKSVVDSGLTSLLDGIFDI
jgi:hypothetical protein